jgi:hypothetical protein
VTGEHLPPLHAAKTGSGWVASTLRRGQRKVAEHRISRGPSILHRPHHTIVRLRRDLDIATTPALRERLLAMHRAGMKLLILDLSRASSCDVADLAACPEYADKVPGRWRGRT